MKLINITFSRSILAVFFGLISFYMTAQTTSSNKSILAGSARTSPIDINELEAGKINYETVARGNAKDVTIQEKHNSQCWKYWFDEYKGRVYGLSSCSDTGSIRNAQDEYGLIAGLCYPAPDNTDTIKYVQKNLFLDIHYLGKGKISAKDVEGAHKKDLVVQGKYGVNFISYWLNEKEGVVICLSTSPDSSSILNTHREAHGLVPVSVLQIKKGE